MVLAVALCGSGGFGNSSVATPETSEGARLVDGKAMQDKREEEQC